MIGFYRGLWERGQLLGYFLGEQQRPLASSRIRGGQGGDEGVVVFLEAFPGLEPEGVGELLPAVGGGA